MTIERLAQGIARRFGGLGTSRASFVRIHAWALAFLVAVSVLVPAHKVESRVSRRTLGPVQNVARSYHDQRAYLTSAFPRRGYFHIAWVQGSEGEVFRSEFRARHLATLVRRVLPKIDGRPVVIDVYYLPGMFLGDEYMSLLDALSTKPDMVVFSLNPVWVLNPLATHQWTQLETRAAAALAGRPRDWPVAAAMLSPSDLVWGLAQSALRPVAERTYWNQRVHDLVDNLGPLRRSKLERATRARRPSLEDRILHDRAYLFWFNRRLHLPAGTEFLLTRENMSAAKWATFMDASNDGRNQLNRLLLHAIARALTTARTPSYVYLSQINSPWLADPTMGRTMRGIEGQLAGLRGAFGARSIRFQPRSASRFVPGLRFLPLDTVHMTYTAGFAPYLARELCALEAQTGTRATCVPTGTGGEPS